MKYLFALGSLFLLFGCSGKKLSRDQALTLIKQAYHYPEVWDYEIFTADPDQVSKMTAAGLEEQGFVTINHHPRLLDMGKPLIQLTTKASPYVLPAEKNDNDSKIVRVKAGEVDFVEVTGIKLLSSGKSAIVEYSTIYKNLTPFSGLLGATANKQKLQKAYFSLFDDGWRVEKKPGIEFLSN